MKVYFAELVSNPTLVKIGVTADIDARLSTLARSVGDVRLVAMFNGGIATEQKIHDQFRDRRREGEWFERNAAIDAFLAVYSIKTPRLYERKGHSWRGYRALSQFGSDAELAQCLLETVVGQYPITWTKAGALDDVYERLKAVRGIWARRRVKALFSGEARRIELYEVIDLFQILKIPTSKWGGILSGEASDWQRIADERAGWAEFILAEDDE